MRGNWRFCICLHTYRILMHLSVFCGTFGKHIIALILNVYPARDRPGPLMDELGFQHALKSFISVCEKTRPIPGAGSAARISSLPHPDGTKPGADALAADQRLTGFKDPTAARRFFSLCSPQSAAFLCHRRSMSVPSAPADPGVR